jgi:hypothetical protein
LIFGENIERLLKFPLMAGFLISVLIALFIRYGIAFVLFLLNRWHFSTINTLILYGLLFIIARFGTRSKRFGKTFSTMVNSSEETDDPLEKRLKRPFIWSAIWTAFALFSILWITPALILFWLYAVPYPTQMIRLLVYVFGLITMMIYFFINEKGFVSLVDKTMYFIGGLGGMITVVYLTI